MTNDKPKCRRRCIDRDAHLRNWFCASYRREPKDIKRCENYIKKGERFVETGYERP